MAKLLNPEGGLDVRFHFSVLRPAAKDQKAPLSVHLGSSPSLNLDLGSLYDSGSFSDFALVCGEKSFPCHKIVLAARSSVFRDMFAHEV